MFNPMYIVNLFPYFARNNPVSYSWLGSVASCKLGFNKIILIGSKLQLQLPSTQMHQSWISSYVSEMSDDVWNEIIKIEVPESILNRLYDESGDGLNFMNLIADFKFADYADFLLSRLFQISNSFNFIAGISLANDKSFHSVCEILNIPVIYSEGGPIRTPYFNFGTYFFDFDGVNGNHGFDKIYENSKFCLDKNKFLPTMKIIESLYEQNDFIYNSSFSHQYEIGIALQVEDDSNLISYSNGYSSLQLLYKALWVFPRNLICIRLHPLSKFNISSNEFGDIDHSPSVFEFISKCKRLITINSSVAFESLLLGKETYILGGSPLKVFANQNLDRNLFYKHPSFDEFNFFINVYLFLYLIPDWYWLSDEYYRFRLSKPSSQDVFDKNLSSFIDRGYFL
jgi:hypothetical protein